MKPLTPFEESVQHRFDAFCKKVLRNEAYKFHNEQKRRREKEVSLFCISAEDMEALGVIDKYKTNDRDFRVLGFDIVVYDDELADALDALPPDKQAIILLSYFLGFSDREIGERLNIVRSTVSRRRAATLKKLKKFMEDNADE